MNTLHLPCQTKQTSYSMAWSYREYERNTTVDKQSPMNATPWRAELELTRILRPAKRSSLETLLRRSLLVLAGDKLSLRRMSLWGETNATQQ